MRRPGVLNGVVEVEENARLRAGVALIDQHGPPPQQVSMSLEGQVDRCIEQRVSRTDKCGKRLARRCHQRLLEHDALVARQDRLSDADDSVSVADRRRHVRGFVAPRFPLLGRSAQALKRFEEERLDVVRLKPLGLGPLHLLPDSADAAGVHRIVSEGAILQKVLNLAVIERMLHNLCEPGANLGLIAVPDGLDQQILQGPALENDLAEYVEDAAAQCPTRFLELLEQPSVNVALARLLGHEVPQMADLRLTDAVDAAEPLLEAIGIPRQIVIDHQMRALEVDALPRRVGGEQHLHFGIVLERLLSLEPFFAPHAAVNHDDRALATQQRADAAVEVIQRVAMLGEDHQLLPRRWAPASGSARSRAAGPVPRLGSRSPTE